MADVEEHWFDVRVVEARIRRGSLKAEDYKKYLDALPDDAEHSEPCKVSFATAYAHSHYRGSHSL